MENKIIQGKLYSYSEPALDPSPRRSLRTAGNRLSEVFKLEKYHQLGITGKGVKIAIFDSGLADIYSNNEDSFDSEFLNVKKVINFTHDKSTKD